MHDRNMRSAKERLENYKKDSKKEKSFTTSFYLITLILTLALQVFLQANYFFLAALIVSLIILHI